MPALVLYADYSREEVHAIFSPDTVFTPQAGTWGLQGVVPIPDRPWGLRFLCHLWGNPKANICLMKGLRRKGCLSWQSAAATKPK